MLDIFQYIGFKEAEYKLKSWVVEECGKQIELWEALRDDFKKYGKHKKCYQINSDNAWTNSNAVQLNRTQQS